MELSATVDMARLQTAGETGDTPPEVPTLTVVKLKPRGEPAPAVDARIPVVEPDFKTVSQLLGTADQDSPRPRRVVTDPSLNAEFDQGIASLKTGNVSGGVAKLERFARDNPRHPKADDALYFSGIGLMGMADYASAARTFERLIGAYPAGNVLMDAMLRLAECRVRLHRETDARNLYSQVVSRYPGTAAANQAEQRLASLAR
jgi:tol-pal system protein YbgF